MSETDESRRLRNLLANVFSPAPSSNNQALAAQMSQAVAAAVVQNVQVGAESRVSYVRVEPLAAKARISIGTLTDALPMRVLQKISYVSLDGDPLRFIVSFSAGHRMEFFEVDKFPSDADIARIALECP